MTSVVTRLSVTALALAGLVVVPGCGGTNVTRVEENTEVDISGRWNDTDSRKVAETLVTSSLQKSWCDAFTAKNSRKPVVRLGKVVVRSNGDDISTEIFLNDLRRAFVNSGKITVVQNKVEAAQTRDEIQEQADFAGSNRKKAAQETGADFLLKGVINVQDDIEGKKGVKFYSVDLDLTDIQSGEMVWTDNKKIKKIVERSNTKW
jgi:PBP1b-binding outer membrane lipoprotein LpoB